jgi:DNA-binding XRE family transcriptional regulator
LPLPFHEKLEPADYPGDCRNAQRPAKSKANGFGLYQEHVAKLLGVTEDTICYWENNRVSPSRLLLPTVLQFLEGKHGQAQRSRMTMRLLNPLRRLYSPGVSSVFGEISKAAGTAASTRTLRIAALVLT